MNGNNDLKMEKRLKTIRNMTIFNSVILLLIILFFLLTFNNGKQIESMNSGSKNIDSHRIIGKEIPQKLSEKGMETLVKNIVEKYNADSKDQFYELMGSEFKFKIKKSEFKEQLERLKKIMGKIIKYNYYSTEYLTEINGLSHYNIYYNAKLNVGDGIMKIIMTCDSIDDKCEVIGFRISIKD